MIKLRKFSNNTYKSECLDHLLSVIKQYTSTEPDKDSPDGHWCYWILKDFSVDKLKSLANKLVGDRKLLDWTNVRLDEINKSIKVKVLSVEQMSITYHKRDDECLLELVHDAYNKFMNK